MIRQDTNTEDALLRSLAMTLAENAGATLQEMARAAGVSRATLYRFAATREQVLEILRSHVLKVMVRILDTAGLETAPPLDALRRLIANHIAEREYCVFLISEFDPYIKGHSANAMRDECTELETRMDQFFQRGQQAGAFRSDVPSRWLTDLFFGFIYALCESEYRGRIARSDMQRLFEDMFLSGARAR